MKKRDSYSKIIAGTMTWGSWGEQLPKIEMADLMNFCVSIGINTFDHADIYGSYSTEKAFGAAFKESGIDRTKIQLISKCGIQMSTGRKNTVAHYQYDADYIIWSAEQSLKNLNTEYLDLLLIHRPSPLMRPNAIAVAVKKLKAAGKIKAFGVSNFTPSQIAMLETEIPVSANQVEFSLTHDIPMYDGTFDDCIAHNRVAMAWSPLGRYFKEKNKQNERIKKAFKSLEKKYDANASQLLLAFIMQHPSNCIPVVGTTKKDRLKQSLEALSIPLELEDWFIMLEASKGEQVP